MTGAWAPFPGPWGSRDGDGEPEATDLRSELLAANGRWRWGRSVAGIPRAPVRGLIVVTCMDGRLDPLPQLGLEPGDAHVLRNAGAHVTDDVLRSLERSHTLCGTTDVVLIGHSDCLANGTEQTTDAVLADGARRLAETPLRVHVLRYDTQTGALSPFTPAPGSS